MGFLYPSTPPVGNPFLPRMRFPSLAHSSDMCALPNDVHPDELRVLFLFSANLRRRTSVFRLLPCLVHSGPPVLDFCGKTRNANPQAQQGKARV